MLFLMIVFFLLIALIFVFFPLRKNSQFLFFAILLTSVSLGLYTWKGQWVDYLVWEKQGKAHYALLKEVSDLGGIDGMIKHIQAQLASNPKDTKGWIILGKLLLAKEDYQEAYVNLKKALMYVPDNEELKTMYTLASDRLTY